MSQPTAVVWLRRDLRLADNLALHHAVESGAKIVVLYVLDPVILGSNYIGAPRVKFMTEALNDLDLRLREYGAHLLIRHGEPSEIVASVALEVGADQVYYNHDYTPYTRKRDEAVQIALGAHGISFHAYHDRVLLAPDAIFTGSGKPYAVYTPYKTKWRETAKPFSEPVKTDFQGVFHDLSGVDGLSVPTPASLGFEGNIISTPEATPKVAQRLLSDFIRRNIFSYAEARDTLAEPFDDPRNGTSSLSPYIRWGLVSPRQLRKAAADATAAAPNEAAREGVTTWVDELIWAEFYTQVLWHFPHVKTQSFKPEYDLIEWRHAPDDLAAWQEGRTGYPVVDAAMRQLNATGWMHNRARMIVASFLTKDLLIDWREGERYFMQKLLDGDLAANNGGWQWAAGTGTDAQPYFRIFNPASQSEKFDPEAIFIQKWIPALRGYSVKYIHAPWTMNNAPHGYPRPMVDHSEARHRTLEAFSVVKKQQPPKVVTFTQ